MGSPVTPVIANIYMEYFEELALGPQCPIPNPWWKGYVDDVICISKKCLVDMLFNHINNMDDHMKLTMECPDKGGNIPFLDTKCTPNPNHIIHTYIQIFVLEFQPSNICKNIFIQALTHRAKMVCCTPELSAKEMGYLNKVLHRNSYLDWFLKNLTTGLYGTSHQPGNPQGILCYSPLHQGTGQRI